MGFIKKVLLATIVLAISSGIFFLVVQEQEVKENILRASLEMFGSELLAMVPDGPEKERLAQKMNQFIDKAENNEVPTTQMQEFVSAGLTMKMNQEEIPPAKLEAMLELSMDTTVVHEKKRRSIRSRTEEERFAHQVKQMVYMQKRMERLMDSDSVKAKFRKQILFDRDSTGLVMVVPPNFQHHDRSKIDDELRRELRELERENMLRYEELKEIQELAEMGLEFVMPAIPPPARDLFMQEMQKLQKSMMDSLQVPSFVFNPDSLAEFIKKIEQQAEQGEQEN